MSKHSRLLVKNTVVLSLGTFCTKGMMFLLTPLFTRWLSQSDYGLFDLLFTYISLLLPFITLDCGEAVFRFLLDSNEEKDREAIISSALAITIVGFCVMGIFAVWGYIQNEINRSIILVFFLLMVIEAIYNFFVYIVRGLKLLPLYAVSNIIFVICMMLSSFFLVGMMGLGIQGIFWAYIVGYLISSFYILKKINIWNFASFKCIDFHLLVKMLKFSIPLMPNAISWWIINVSDRTIVSTFLGSTVNAIYSVANKMPNLCQTFFGVFHLSWQESAVASMDDKDRDEYYSSVMNNMVKVIGSICIIVIACNFLYFKFLFSEDYFTGYFHVPILVSAIIFSVLAQFIGGIYIARMESVKNGFTTFITAIINISVHLLLINIAGLFAASISTFCAYFMLFLIRFIDIRRNIKLKLNKASIVILICVLYYVISAYFNSNILNVSNLLGAIVLFVLVNRQYINKVRDLFK